VESQHRGCGAHGTVQHGVQVARSDHGAERSTLDEAIDTMLKLLAPMSPARHRRDLGDALPRPVERASPGVAGRRPELVKHSTITMVIQINGKVKARLEVPPDISMADAETKRSKSRHQQGARRCDAQEDRVATTRLVNIIV